MYSEWVGPQLVYIIVVFVWLGVLSFLIWKEFNFLKSLFPKIGERDIRKKFEEVINAVAESNEELRALEKKLSQLEIEGLKHIQKISLLRYNPYEDTGGNISFSLALLDKKGNGYVLTSLHARSGTRIFAKPVVDGKEDKYELSKEEEEVLKKALKQKDD